MSENIDVMNITYVETETLHPRNWNPNEMAPDKFNQLVAKVEREGFTDPIKCCPVDTEDVDPSWAPGKKHYWIWAGEHRWRVAQLKEMLTVPVIIYEGSEWSEYEQKLATVRDNFVHGEMNSKKFTELVKSLDSGLDVDPSLFGFTSEQEMDKYLIREKTEGDKSFLDGFMEAANQQKEAVEGLSDVIATIFEQCAQTVDQNYLAFAYKGNAVCIVLASTECYAEVKKMIEHLQDTGGDISEFMKEAIQKGLIK